MELKDYQVKVLAHLENFFDVLDTKQNLVESFKEFWLDKGVRINNGLDKGMEPYKNTVPGVPHICVKVPTAGGKTYIAVNALSIIFSALKKRSPSRTQMVVWLVPSLTILDQTVKAFNSPNHPYHKSLNQLFKNRVAIYEKRNLLLGEGFTFDTAQEQLSIVVMSFDSLRSKNKEALKIYQENGNLASFLLPQQTDSADWLLPGYDPSSLINVLRGLRPVVVVDESHNAESLLSVEMLKNLNPDVILDLTATPRNNSNIISYVDALALKRQHMVKLPVIVANRTNKAEVIEASLILRRQLEAMAVAQEAKGGKYIRPIVLFQAQPKTNEDNTTFEKIKTQLLALDIPAEQIKIKTADVDELKGQDLMSKTCEVRYIITVNALKEGWDCPFAYILASLADKSSQIDVEQILGRVLRMPHVQQHPEQLLNMSYVFTASNRFLDTLTSIVKGLNRAGFSEKDCRTVDAQAVKKAVSPDAPSALGDLFKDAVADAPADDEIDLSQIAQNWKEIAEEAVITSEGNEPWGEVPTTAKFIEKIKEKATEANKAFEAMADDATDDIPLELSEKMNRHSIKELFRAEAAAMELPQFFIEVKNEGFFGDDEADEKFFQLFEREELLKNFKLSQADSSISFDDVESEFYRVDLEKVGEGDYTPRAFKLAAKERAAFTSYILSLTHEKQVTNLAAHLAALIGNMFPITDPEVKSFIRRVVESMEPEQVRDCIERDFAYKSKIKFKINELATVHAYKQFNDMLDLDHIKARASFTLPEAIAPNGNSQALIKSLYTTEAKMGEFERRLINDIANLESVQWWHRNLSRGKGFRINGFLNHYPDFIIKMKSGRIIVLETKGDDRDNTDSEMKLKLGKLWESAVAALGNYKYFMVFEHNPVDGAERLADALKKIEQL